MQQLAAANGVAHARAHDAMSDVLATLELCRLVYQRSPELWQRFVRFSNKAAVADFVEAEDGFVLTEVFGGQAYHTRLHRQGSDQANGRLCLSLNEDIGRLAAMSDLELQVHLTHKPSPIRRFRINAAPTLTAFYDAPEHMLDGGSIGAIEDQARRMKTDTGLRARLVAAYTAAREPYALSPHIEERIYNGFPGPADEARIAAFHDARWEDRFVIVQGMEDERLRWFRLRLIYFEARSVLPEPARLEVERYLIDQMTGDGSGCLTFDQAMVETERVLGEFAGPDDLLIHYRTHLQDRFARLEAYRTRLVA
ncbi:exonuclease I [Bradyrhizobium sp. USDA 4509]